MKAIIYYFAQMILVSGILYGYYHFFLRNKRFHHYNRYYLLAITVLGIIVPFLNIPIYFSQADTNSSVVLKTLTVISSGGVEEPVVISTNGSPVSHHFSMIPVYYLVYILIALIGLTRVLISLIKIRSIARNNPVSELDNIHFVNTSEPGTPFSFFRWLFWNRNIELNSSKGEQIFRHELFHIEQKHSRDILFIEAVTVVAWINPIFHLIKKELKAIHEFLADRFAVTENSKWEYAELLLMQAFRTNQQLVNPFFHNQIKRRIAMITTSKKPGPQYFRKLMILPLAAILIGLFAFSYRNKTNNNQGALVNKPITVVIDAGHGIDANGKYNGVRAENGQYEDDIVLSIAKRIKEQNTDDNIRILLTREREDLVDLRQRVDYVNNQQADLFISIHCNAAAPVLGTTGNPPSGFEVYVSKKNGTFYSENRILATTLLNYFAQIYPVQKNIQARETGIYTLDASKCPSVLVECGYLTDKEDLAFVSNPANQDKIASSILQSISMYGSLKDGSDWEERKKVYTDTIPPEIILKRNPTTGKMEGTFDGASILQIMESESVGQLVFVVEGKHILISMEQSEKLRKKYGKSLNELIKKETSPDRNIQEINRDGGQKKAYIIEGGIAIKDKDGGTVYLPNARMTVEEADKNKGKPLPDEMLVIIDGKEQMMLKSFVGIEKHIDPSDIYSIDVLKNKASTAKYGEKGKNGVIIIKTKKANPKLITESTQSDNNKIFEKVEVPPTYIGGDLKWRQYLERELNATIVSKKAPPGNYSVVIQFVVGLDGKMSDIRPLTNQGYGMEEEVLRAINKSSLPWTPAMQNGHPVKAYKKQIVTFVLSDDSGRFKESRWSDQNGSNEVVVTALSPSVIEKDNRIFDQTEVPPSFPGGEAKWRQYLERNCNGMIPSDKGAPSGTYSVVVKFIVDQAGNISDIKPLTHHGYGMEDETVRMIAKGPKWKPAIQNGHEVRAYALQKITFVVQDDSEVQGTNPRVYLVDPKEGARLNASDLKNISELRVLNENAGSNWKVESFVITFDHNSGVQKEFTGKGGLFTKEIQKEFSSIELGAYITIESITLKSGSEIRKASPLILKVN